MKHGVFILLYISLFIILFDSCKSKISDDSTQTSQKVVALTDSAVNLYGRYFDPDYGKKSAYKALALLDSAIKIDSSYLRALRTKIDVLGIIRWEIQNNEALQENYQSTLKTYNLYIKSSSSTSPVTLLGRANVLKKLNKKNAALKDINKANYELDSIINLNGSVSSNAYKYKLYILCIKGKYKKAQQFYNKYRSDLKPSLIKRETRNNNILCSEILKMGSF